MLSILQETDMASGSARSEKLDLRLTPRAKQILTDAARASHRSVTDFVLQSALERAEEALADRRVFTLDREKWLAFQEALDAPPRDNAGLARLFERASPFDNRKR